MTAFQDLQRDVRQLTAVLNLALDQNRKINCRVRSRSVSAVNLKNDVSVKRLYCKILGRCMARPPSASGDCQLLADQWPFTGISRTVPHSAHASRIHLCGAKIGDDFTLALLQ
jgi:hypothetical protein